ncbi:MAG: hypothetical protein HFJ29_07230 [Clostridia bacterium]|nr:hypothetical protein [Clostridia bacterium]
MSVDNNIQYVIEKLKTKEKIVGVKNNTSMKIAKEDKKTICVFKILMVIVLIIIVGIFLGIPIASGDIGVFIMSMCLLALLLGTVIWAIREKFKKLYLKISYPFDGVIQIDECILNYKNDNIMIEIEKKMPQDIEKKVNYRLILKYNEHRYGIDLINASGEEFAEFIDNLIFKEKRQ